MLSLHVAVHSGQALITTKAATMDVIDVIYAVWAMLGVGCMVSLPVAVWYGINLEGVEAKLLMGWAMWILTGMLVGGCKPTEFDWERMSNDPPPACVLALLGSGSGRFRREEPENPHGQKNV
jgi:hypothetical protein